MRYTVVYIKGTEEYACDNFIEGATISDIVKELTYNANRYGVDYDEVVNLGDRYFLLEMV